MCVYVIITENVFQCYHVHFPGSPLIIHSSSFLRWQCFYHQVKSSAFYSKVFWLHTFLVESKTIWVYNTFLAVHAKLNMQIQILQTDFPYMIILTSLITFTFDNVSILLGENWCWSLRPFLQLLHIIYIE